MNLWYCEKCKGLSTPLLDESGEVKKLFCGVCVKVTNHVLHLAIPRAELEELVAALEATTLAMVNCLDFTIGGKKSERLAALDSKNVKTLMAIRRKYLKP